VRTCARLLAGLLGFALAAQPATGPAEARIPVLLELFTSEGCSDCPPADKLLESLDRTQPVSGADLIVLSEHVDYWNRLGWSDPWSSAAYSDRQKQYAESFHLTDIYTPQLVIDGSAQMVGSDAAQIHAEISRTIRRRKVAVTLSNVSRDGNRIKLHVGTGPLPEGPVTVYLALADNQVHSQVARGENAGRSLQHVAVLRNLRPLGTVAKGAVFENDATVTASESGVRVIVFLQERSSGRVLGVTQQRL
jgi:hypothetical protein